MSRLELHSTPAAHHVTLFGDLDAIGSTALRASLLETIGDAPRDMILDLAQVPTLSSSGIRVFFEVAKRQRASGVRFVLRHPQDFVATALAVAVAGLDSIITIENPIMPPSKAE
jgi:anti-anti-sigma factor